MFTEKSFKFCKETGTSPPDLEVCIIEEIDPKYGMHIWPCSPVLAQYVWHNKHTVNGKRVLELGAGTSLPGIVAAKCGAIVTISDSELFPNCQEISRRNLERNGLANVSVLGLTWGMFSPTLLQLEPIDIILASDCFYEPKEFEDVIMTLSYFVDRNPSLECWITYQERSSDWTVEDLLNKWNLICEIVPLSQFYNDVANQISKNSLVHLWKIYRIK